MPVLMCPDDCDLWCTVIVANVVIADGYLIWKQIGIDKSTRDDLLLGYDRIGSKVEWLDKIPSMTFNKEDYLSQLRKIYD